ncbi:baseplate J/gp47 family protein [Paenibacillus sp. GCM10012307]|uniref:Baseplate J/gp47 family protein n=1 Tax=Paenibacillus roseus TaxID=2798579 RepID=A0A934J5I6_9BACL|nr:baseplate J/gp47 family protein [Paenibacillus roseus]MBJ6362089.1 baseplate J/gp47 family protein [Paenibacillus roseus]
MSLPDLPDIEFVNSDPEEVKLNIITAYEAISGRKLFPGDPVRLFLYAVASIIVQQRALINYSAKQNLLRYASGAYLDHLGALVETVRAPAGTAVTTVRFTLSAPQAGPVSIPEGIRVTAGADLFFATIQYAEILAGELSIDLPCVCLTPGVIGNGLLPGQINTLVDPQPYIADIANLTESSGGTDVETDERYRERIYTSPERFSVAGPTGGYEYWAKTASPDISDVLVWSPAPGEVEIRVLMAGGELPTQDTLDAVYGVCNDERIRPLTDRVAVLAPDRVPYDVDLTYWIDSRSATAAMTIQAGVQAAVRDYVLWQKSRIGRDLNPSELTRRVMNAGARRVVIGQPEHQVMDKTAVAVAVNTNVTYGGLEDD